MKNLADFIRKAFSPNGPYRTPAFLFLILAAMLLVVFSLGVMINSGDWQKAVPRFGDLVTSPAIKNLTINKQAGQEEQSQNEHIAEKETAAEQEIEPVNSVGEIKEDSDFVAAAPSRPATAPDSDRADIIVIPAIGITAPLISPPDNTNAAELKALLDDGAIIYPDSVSFGKDGQTIVLGHSAPPNWPEIKHDTIFSRIAELNFNDKIIAVYNDRTYTYSVKHSEIVAKGADIPKMENTNNELVLVTCWPPGRDLKRIIVQAELDSVD